MYELAQLTPGQVEKITDLSSGMQRDWRRRGLLPSTDGHARFDLFEVSNLLVMKLLADRGVGPVRSGEVSEIVAVGVAWYALQDVDAYEGDHLRTFEWDPQGRGVKRDRNAEIRRVFEKQGQNVPPDLDFEAAIYWGGQAEWIARRIFSRRRIRVVPAQYFIWWGDESHEFHHSLDEAFGDVSTAPKYAKAAIVLDLQAVASTLVQAAGRALVRVEYDKDRDGRVLSPDPEIEFSAPIPVRVVQPRNE